MKELDESLHFVDRKIWRAWLRTNHSKMSEQWLMFYKVHTGKPCIGYDAAVEEALCYGWIDGKLKRVDGERHVIRFTLRRRGSVWAVSNKKRVRGLMRKKKMTKAGMAALEGIDLSDDAIAKEEREQRDPKLPGWAEKVLKENERAWKAYQALTPSHRKRFIWWLQSTKREDTKMKRLAEMKKMLKEGKPLEM